MAAGGSKQGCNESQGRGWMGSRARQKIWFHCLNLKVYLIKVTEEQWCALASVRHLI